MADQPFEIAWTRSARRTLSQLPPKVLDAVVEFVYGPLADHPTRVGKRLRFELEGHWSARRGDFRIIYLVDDERRRVTVEVVGHRSDVYRRR